MRTTVVGQRTCVVCDYDCGDRDPHNVENEALPIRSVCGDAAFNAPEVVADRLDGDVKQDHDKRKAPAPAELDQVLLHLAAPAGSDSDVASVHDLAQAPKDHGHTGTQADHGRSRKDTLAADVRSGKTGVVLEIDCECALSSVSSATELLRTLSLNVLLPKLENFEPPLEK